MAEALSEEQWRTVLELSETVADLPVDQRRPFLDFMNASPEIAHEVLELVGEFHADASPSPEPFAEIGRFVITGRMGRGGMGEVYAARDTELDRRVALKILRPDITGTHGAVQGFIREAQTASALNHPNIVTIHEVIRSESRTAIVMELVEGTPLRDLCATPPSTRQVIEIGRQIAQALAAAHGLGIVHRDIKPENVVVRPDGRVKVLDFGLARQIHREALTSKASLPAGTLRYMSPEQSRGESVSPPSDVFSLGLVLYELATGRHAFRGDSALEIAHAILTQEPVVPARRADTVGERLDRLILSMLAKDSRARPSAETVVRELRGIQESSEKISPAAVASAPSRVRRFQLSHAILAASFVAAILAIIWSRTGKGDATAFSDVKTQPLTSQAGWETAPALAHDGQSIAFTWTARMGLPRQIYVKRLDSSQPIRLTEYESGNVGYLTWSPDGRRIAFARLDQSGAVYSISSTGGDEKKIVDLSRLNLSSAIDWSPDGSLMAFSDVLPDTDRLAIFLYNLRTGEKRKLTSPPPGTWGDWNPKFSPDGSAIAFKRVTGFWADDMYLIRVAGGNVQRITTTGRGIWGHAWTADGESLLVSCQRNTTIFGIWKFSVRPSGRPERVELGGADAITPSTGRKTTRAAWVYQLWDLNIYRAALTGDKPPEKLIASTVRDQGAVYSPDGRIAWISDRSGSREIWVGNGDGSGETQVTNFNGPQIDHMQWSPDGRKLIFDSRPRGISDIFVLECDSSGRREEPKRLDAAGQAEAPAWSADGQSIYFASNRTGQFEIWKLPASGGLPIQVTQHGAYRGYESPDGQWLYYTRDGSDGIFRIRSNRAEGSDFPAADRVIGPPYNIQREGWSLTRDEIVFIDRPTSLRPAAIRSFQFATRQVRTVLGLTEVFPDRGDIGVSVSPDARWIVFPQLDRSGSNVIVAESLR